MNIQVIKSRRRTIGIEVNADGKVIVRTPLRMSSTEINRFIEEHDEWIRQKLDFVRQKSDNRHGTGAPGIECLSKQELDNIKDTFEKRVQFYCNIMNVSVGRITIRNQKTRWGSCSSKGNVNFNYQLYYMPQELMDYVIVHELSHRRYMNHSAQFWSEVEKYCPEYGTCRKQLKEYELT